MTTHTDDTPRGCTTTRELIDHHVSGELPDAMIRAIDDHTAACDECRRALEDRRRVRGALRRAVTAESGPDALRERIDERLRARARARILRLGTWPRSAYAIATALLVGVAAWSVLRTFNSGSDTEALDGGLMARRSLERTSAVLRVGLADHIHCVVQFHGDRHTMTFEQMAEEMGPDYIGLVPLVRRTVEGFDVVVAHQCATDNRRFVHMILRRGNEIVSLAITRKHGETFAIYPDAAVSTVSNVPLYRARFHEGQDFDVTGFETEEFLAFVIADADLGRNEGIAGALAPVLGRFLDRLS